MEETGCEIICGAPSSLAVKGEMRDEMRDCCSEHSSSSVIILSRAVIEITFVQIVITSNNKQVGITGFDHTGN